MLPVYIGLIFFLLDANSVMLFGRFSGFFDNPNHLGIYIVAILPIVIFCSAGELLFFRLFLLFFPLFLSVVLSGSFSQLFLFLLISFFSFSVVFLYENFGWFDFCQIIIFSLGCFFLFLFLNNIDYFEGLRSIERFLNFLNGFDSSLGSMDVRSKLNDWAINEIINSKDLYLIGNGYGMSRYSIDAFEYVNLSPHNLFLVSILDVGLIGAFTYFSMIFIFFKNKVKNTKHIVILLAFFSSFFVTPYIYLLILIAPTIFYFSLKIND